MREVDDRSYTFVRVVHEIYRSGGEFYQAIDEGKVAAHTRLQHSENKGT